MKTKADLIALIPTIVDLLENNDHEIGISNVYSCCNSLCYEQDGWTIDVSYKCEGLWDYDPGDYFTPEASTLKEGWGKVTAIEAYHYDELTGEEIEFSDADLTELWNALDQTLENI